MRIFVDTNVILDVIEEREPFYNDSRAFMLLCAELKSALAPHTITNIFFTLRKKFTQRERKKILLDLLPIMDVVIIGKYQIVNALKNQKIGDFEDALQLECAREFNAEYIVTRDPKHFKGSEIETISPAEFVKRHG